MHLLVDKAQASDDSAQDFAMGEVVLAKCGMKGTLIEIVIDVQK